MIKLGKHNFDFGCAAGALAFDGKGWWYDQPFIWSGLLRPSEFTIITKTVTVNPIVGNYRWWCPWRCVRLFQGGAINAVGLTNPGIDAWLTTNVHGVIASVMPFSLKDAEILGTKLRNQDLIAVQVNLSCPNVKHDDIQIDTAVQQCQIIAEKSNLPVIAKLAYQDDYLSLCRALEGKIAAIELINTLPFDYLYPENKSPLSKYGLVGGISGPPIKRSARDALRTVIQSKLKTPIISGGGIDSLDEVYTRKRLGASGFVFGTLFMRKPWAPNQIIAAYRKNNF